MKAQQYELDLLHAEGYEYFIIPKRGWYFRGKWIGYNVKDAFEHRAKRETGRLNDSPANQWHDLPT